MRFTQVGRLCRPETSGPGPLFVRGGADLEFAAGVEAVDDIEVAAVDRRAIRLGGRIADDGADDGPVDVGGGVLDARAIGGLEGEGGEAPASEAMTAAAAMMVFMGIFLSE